MNPDTILITTVITLMGGGLGTLFWSRLNRIEANMVTRKEFDQFREEIRSGFVHVRRETDGLREGMDQIRDEMGQLREEMGQLRQEQAVMRSDLTHVALAVGAQRPKASGG